MCANWNYKRDVWGMILCWFLLPVIGVLAALTFPIIHNHPILFVAVALTIAVAGLVYLIRRKK